MGWIMALKIKWCRLDNLCESCQFCNPYYIQYTKDGSWECSDLPTWMCDKIDKPIDTENKGCDNMKSYYLDEDTYDDIRSVWPR